MCLGFQSKPCFSHTRSTRETTEVLCFSIGCCPTSSVVWLFYWLLPDLAFTGNGQPLEGRTTNPKGYSGVTHTQTHNKHMGADAWGESLGPKVPSPPTL